MKPRVIAIHLPQFHPIPENDRWWGKGFTEWRNVARTRVLFNGHEQPHVPSDLGYYDLRLHEARVAQAELAQAHGIDGFCYYHYWFHGKQLLEQPVNGLLSRGKPDFPFCLFWANEPWSRRWTGDEKEVLMDQTYSPEDDIAHARWLCRAFADPRYIRVKGRPVFIIYRPHHLPDVQASLARLRQECIRAGVGDPYLIGADARCGGTDCRSLGFDTTLRFEPKLGALPHSQLERPSLKHLWRNLKLGVFSARLKVYDYLEACKAMRWYNPDYPIVPSVFVGFDNTPRRGAQGLIVVNNSPAAFQMQVENELRKTPHPEREDDLLFINAWNEWAEGNHLEPDLRHGHAYLDALKSAIDGAAAQPSRTKKAVAQEAAGSVLA